MKRAFAGEIVNACAYISRLRPIAVAVMVSVAYFDATAQTVSRDSSKASMNGCIVTAVGQRPVEGAIVSLKEANRSVRTTSSGGFEIAGVPPGSYSLTVRKIGYGPINARVTLEANKVLGADLELYVSSTQQLEEVTVRADSTRYTPVSGFAERMHSSAGGIFLERAQLDSAHGTPLSEVLRKRVRGVNIVLYPSKGAQLLASGRGLGSLTRVPKADPTDPRSPAACFSQVYVDGMRIYSPSENSEVPDLRRFEARELEAVEFYPGPATTPVQYSGEGAFCGTLLIWMRAR